jgi:hypothetical protein
MTVDERATADLRKQMASQRGAKKLFDRGFESLADLKSRCLAETGLAAPAQPEFTQRKSARSEAAAG